MTANQKKSFTVNMEVIKFSFSVGIPLFAAIGMYFDLRNDVTLNTENNIKHEVQIEAIESGNHARDIETAKFRTDINNRVENIETLTKEIHTIIVNNN